MGVYGSLRRDDLAARVRSFESYSRWEAQQRYACPPSVALEGVGLIWELMPPESRERPVDPSGVERMHSLLRGFRAVG